MRIFGEILSGDIYVDKTMMISALNQFMGKGNKYICVSRPRRFGKTVTQNMLSAYYSKGCDSRKIFEKLKISQVSGYEKNLNRFNVIKIDMNGEYQAAENKADTVRNLIKKVKREIREQFGSLSFYAEGTLADMMLQVYAQSGETFILLIDEYDILVREKVEEKLFSDYLSFLNGLFKNDTLRPAISLAYITGILPVIRDKVQSKLNNEKAVARALDVSHINVSSNRSYNNEDVLQSAVCLAYIYALNEYTVVREMTAGKGFVDVVFIPFKKDAPAMIIELKRNQSPEHALAQIKQKRYFDSPTV